MADIGRLGKIERAFYRTAIRLVPKNRFGDRFLAFTYFVAKQHRLPTNRPLFNDALYRIKTTDEVFDPLRVFVSDKEFVKLYVKAIVGDEYNVPTLAVLRSPAEVDAYDFPAECCIKPTQASGAFIFRRAGEPIDRNEIKRWFSLNHYAATREANYRHLVPKIIVEPLLTQDGGLLDYRFFCAGGKAKFITVDTDWTTSHRSRQLFDADWNRQPYSLGYPPGAAVQDRPANFATMKEVAEKLAAGFTFIRVDFYNNGQTCMVGEMTNCHANTGGRFIPPEAEREASRLLFG